MDDSSEMSNENGVLLQYINLKEVFNRDYICS